MRRCLTPCALALIALALASAPARAQTAVVGTYSYFWTNAANTPITSVTVNSGDTLSVRLWAREAGGGNVFDGNRTAPAGAFAGQIVGGLGGFDSIFSLATGGTGIVRLAPVASPVTGQRYAGVTASPQFGGSEGGFFQQDVATFNSTGTAPSFAQPASDASNPTTYARDTVAPNLPGSIYLYQIDFQTGFTGSATGTTTLTGAQGTGSNYGYYTGSGFAVLDSTIAAASAPLTIAVVPEPASVVGLGALALAGAGVARRRAARYFRG